MKARGNSVGRNRVKRRVREEMRRHAAILASFDYNVVIPGSRKLVHPYPRKLGGAIRKELPDALAKLG
jgi:ribonuclease P protein component